MCLWSFVVLRCTLLVFIVLLLTACTANLSTPTVQSATPAVAFTDTPVPTSVPDIYTQNIHLFDYDAETRVEITENGVQQQDGYTVQDISYPSPKGGNVPAYLVVPDEPGPFAGIILMHGSSGTRETLLPLAEDIVHTGAVVMTVSGPSARSTGRSWIHFTPQDRDEQIQLIIDLRRAVDLLMQHEKVDPSRIGYVGYSYGAAMGGLLAGTEPRIKAYGLMVGDGGLVNHFTDESKPIGGFETVDSTAQQAWLAAMAPIEPIYYVGHAAPSALFFQNARHDALVSEEDALAYQAAGSEPKKIEWYDSNHGLPTQAYIDMMDWLAEQIGIDATRFSPSR
jgi:pimeloyl-ACP methyl ester carboxylesterase